MRYRPLRDLYAECNVRFWEGRLPAPERAPAFGGDVLARISVRRVGAVSVPMTREVRGLRADGGVSCFGTFRPPTGKIWPARIRVLSPLADEGERAVLLHEMCHAAVWFSGFHDEKHGPRFIAELERLAAMGEAWAVEDAARYKRELTSVAERVQHGAG